MKLRRISKEELAEVLREHKKWLDSNEKEGKRADLSYTNLSHTDFRYTNLRRANLSYTNLEEANLSYADLSFADLSNAKLQFISAKFTNLSGANLEYAKIYSTLEYADLSNAFLNNADLKEIRLEHSNLSFAYLINANLQSALFLSVNFCHADIRGTNFYDANLYDVELKNVKYDNTTQYFSLQCPEQGEFVAYKKAYEPTSNSPCIVKLLIPADALRSSATTKKCRCNKAKVLSITSLNGEKKYRKAYNNQDHQFIYKTKKMVKVPDFDKDKWKERAPGIHFFMCRMDAVNY